MRRGNGSGATPMAISVDDVLIIVKEGPEVHLAKMMTSLLKALQFNSYNAA